jgi:hypothetical protein
MPSTSGTTKTVNSDCSNVIADRRRLNLPRQVASMSNGLTSPLNEEVVHRIRGEYTEMPGLRITLPQAQRLWGLDAALCRLALDCLVQTGFLRRTEAGQYLRLSDGAANTLPLRMAKAEISTSAEPADRRPAAI